MAGTVAALLASKPSGLRRLLRYVRPCSYLCGCPPSLTRSTSVRPVPERQDSEISRPPPLPAAAAATAAASTIEEARQVVHVDVAGHQDPNKLPEESGNQDKHHKQQQQSDQAPPAPAPVPPADSHRGSGAAAAAMPAESRADDAA